eukprot:30939-Pelagococcus_subviridis.AAC.4
MTRHVNNRTALARSLHRQSSPRAVVVDARGWRRRRLSRRRRRSAARRRRSRRRSSSGCVGRPRPGARDDPSVRSLLERPRLTPSAPASLPPSRQVMRTCAPTLKIDTPSRFALDDLGHPPCAPSTSTSSDVAFESRVDLGLRASRASGVTGTLCLPQAFGNVYLGETFAAYVSAINSSDRVVRDVSFKAELQTERRRVALFDNAAEAAPTMPPGATFDFTATHDLKELGAHTLVCGVVYTDADGERKYAPQYFKFNAANPLAVRTKVRPGRDGRALLEACIENATPAPLLLSRATFEPCAHLECDEIVPACVSGAGVVIPEGDPHRGEEGGGGGGGGGGGARDAAAAGGSGLGEGLPSLANRPLRVLSPQGGSTHFLFELRQRPDITVTSDTLGKLEIRWTGHNGEAGRLQTQQIVGSPRIGGKDVEVAFAHGAPPKTARVHAPLTLSCVVTNKTASATRALEVIAQPDSDV